MRALGWSSLAFCCACSAGGTDPTVAPSEPELVTFDAMTASESLDTLVLSMPWQLANPLTQPVTVAQIQWQLHAGALEASGTVTPGLAIAAGGTLKDALIARAPISAGVEAGATPYSVVATFDVSDGRELSQFEAEWHGTTVLPQAPALTLEAQAGRHGTDSIELNFIVGVRNANGFDLHIATLDHRLLLEGVQVGAGTLVQDHRLRAASALEFQVGRVVSLKELRLSSLRAAPLRYRTDVSATVSGRVVTQTFEGELAFER